MRRLLLATVGWACVPFVLPAADIDAVVRQKMQQFVDSGDIAGAVAVIGRKTGIVSHEAVGSLNLEAKQPMPKDALFRIASMTKPITAIGIMMLQDEGRLTVDDPVEKFLPEFKGQMLMESGSDGQLRKPRRPITLKDLLTHTSGMPGMPPREMADLYVKRHLTLAEAVPAFARQPLTFEPGTKWAYCNTGIDTLGRVIEVVAEVSYEDFLRDRLFLPLGMTSTTFNPTAEQRIRLAQLYGKKDGQLVPADNAIIGTPPQSRYPIPAGGLYSTGADLAALYQMMLNNGTLGNLRFLSEAAVKAMTQNQIGELKGGFTPGTTFGFGWAVVRDPQGVTAQLSPGSYGHGGAFGTQGWIDPQRGTFIVLLIQRTGLPNADASPMRQALHEITATLP